MKHEGLGGSFWPTDEQRLLLRLVLGPEDEAPATWQELRPLDVEAVEAGTFPLLPLAARQLEQIDPAAPELARLRGTYRKTWYRNQVHVRRLGEVMRLSHRGVLLGGIAIAAAYYPSLGTRPVFATGVLVEPGTRSTRAGGGLEFSLREMLPVPLYSGAEAAFRERAAKLEIGETSAAVLDTTDELLLVIAEGARAKDPPSIQWLLDAHQIASSGRVDWEAFAERSVAAHLVRPVSDTFAYLASVTGRPLDGAIARLATLKTSRRERLAGRLTSMALGRAGMLPRHLGDFLRVTADEPLLRAAWGLPDHLRAAWGLERATEVPAAALRKAADRARGSHRRAGPETPPGR